MYCASWLAEGLHIMSQPQPANQDGRPQCHAQKAAEREFNEHKPPTLCAEAGYSAPMSSSPDDVLCRSIWKCDFQKSKALW